MTRSGASVVSKMRGSHSAACSQNGGRYSDLNDKRGEHHNKTRAEYDEYCRPVAAIGEAIIQPAAFAFWPQRQKSVEQAALAAVRTAAAQATYH